MKRTNVVLDEKLVKDCIKVTGIKTQKLAVSNCVLNTFFCSNELE
jgi:Arc/MetJ family transcription regulator